MSKCFSANIIIIIFTSTFRVSLSFTFAFITIHYVRCQFLLSIPFLQLDSYATACWFLVKHKTTGALINQDVWVRRYFSNYQQSLRIIQMAYSTCDMLMVAPHTNHAHFRVFSSSFVPGGGTSIPLIESALPRSGRNKSTKWANRRDEFLNRRKGQKLLFKQFIYTKSTLNERVLNQKIQINKQDKIFNSNMHYKPALNELPCTVNPHSETV